MEKITILKSYHAGIGIIDNKEAFWRNRINIMRRSAAVLESTLDRSLNCAEIAKSGILDKIEKYRIIRETRELTIEESLDLKNIILFLNRI